MAVKRSATAKLAMNLFGIVRRISFFQMASIVKTFPTAIRTATVRHTAIYACQLKNCFFVIERVVFSNAMSTIKISDPLSRTMLLHPAEQCSDNEFIGKY